MKVDFIELTNFRGIQKQRITFENKNFVAFEADVCYNDGINQVYRRSLCSDTMIVPRFCGSF